MLVAFADAARDLTPPVPPQHHPDADHIDWEEWQDLDVSGRRAQVGYSRHIATPLHLPAEWDGVVP